jgi:uncharacterized cupredoxin-like copper-binding protein
VNRREFLKATAAAGGALAAISALPVQAEPLALQDQIAALVGDRISPPRPWVAESAAATVAASGAQAVDSSAVVKVTISDGSMQVDQSSVPAGPVTFQVSIDGNMAHEINVLKTQLDPKSLPEGTEPGVVDEAAVGDKAGEIEDIPPDMPQQDTFDMTSGRFVVICNLPGHYAKGEVATLVVK